MSCVCVYLQSVEGQKATATFRQFSSIFQRLSTEQILYQYRIAEPELLDLTQAPAKLLFTIFEHDSILKRPLSRSILDSHPGQWIFFLSICFGFQEMIEFWY